MSARTLRNAENKPTPKKLHLRKETLKDLTAEKGTVRGGNVNRTKGVVDACPPPTSGHYTCEPC